MTLVDRLSVTELTKQPTSTGHRAVTEHSLVVGDLQRSYLTYQPESLRPGASLIIAYHPSQGSAGDMRRYVGSPLEAIAREHNAVVVYPDGYGGHFNDCRRAADYPARRRDIDDVGFARALVEHHVRSDGVNPDRVFAIGFSNGGQMALRLALEAPDMIAGVAAFAANLPAADNLDCQLASRPSSRIVLVAGTEDPINPYKGGRVSIFGFGDRGDVLSAQKSAEWFVHRLGLEAAGDRVLVRGPRLTAAARDWRSADGHVRLVTIDGGGHTIPQQGFLFSPWLGPTLRSDIVIAEIWEQFSTDL